MLKLIIIIIIIIQSQSCLLESTAAIFRQSAGYVWSSSLNKLSYCLLIAASAIPGGYYCAPNFFHNSKNLNCIRALSFLRLEEEYWRILFLINFIGVIFEAGNETREKICSDFDAEQKWRAERKESGFCWYRCFWESEKLMCGKRFL